MSTRTRTVAVVGVLAVLVLTGAIAQLALSLETAPQDVRTGPNENGSNGDRTHGLDDLHAAGVTGESVTVGVVDVTGFDRSHPAFADQVADARAFGPGATVGNGGQNGHGTAAAAVLGRTAPDAELYLASFRSPEGYTSAVAWLLQRDVDVIVAPVSFYGKPGDGSAQVARIATAAANSGVVFVAPAGNLARGHWHGEYDRVRDGTLQFDDGPRNVLRGDDERATVWLSWNESRADEDYTAELYRETDDGPRLVARSQPYEADDVPNERIEARLAGGTYFVAVRGPANATGTHLRLSSPTHAFEHARSDGSVVAPATGEGVLGVGAYDPERDRVEPFSSRGPTADGRLGVDVVAPARRTIAGDTETFVGSSAAAPYVAGVAALVLDRRPALPPREVAYRIEGTAADVGGNGTDPVAGHGRVAPGRAVPNATG